MEFRIEWLCRDRKLSVDGHRFSTAKVGAVTMRINLILKTLKRATMCINKCIAASIFTSKPMAVMTKIII
jgi:hypothetical protein